MKPQRVIPLLVPPLRKGKPETMGSYDTKARGMAVLTTPFINKGTAFTGEEREALRLTGLLPPVISTLGRRKYRPPTSNTSGCRMR